MIPRPTSATRRTRSLFAKLERIAGTIPSRPARETVHDLRTVVRRIETLFTADEAEHGHARLKLRKQLARLRRRAGKVRDLDVQMVALGGIRLDAPSRDKAMLMRHLAGLRAKHERKLISAVEDATLNGLQKRIRRAAAQLVGGAQSRPAADYAGVALSKFKQLAESCPSLNEASLHEFRIACKRVRYLAEISGHVPAARAIVRELKRIQDAIGEWHDWLTLTDIAAAVIPNSSSPLISALRAQRQLKFNEAVRIVLKAKGGLLAGAQASFKREKHAARHAAGARAG